MALILARLKSSLNPAPLYTADALPRRRPRRGHAALVAGNQRFYALLLMYEIKCAEIGVRFIRVFRHRPDAEHWLQVTSAARNLR